MGIAFHSTSQYGLFLPWWNIETRHESTHIVEHVVAVHRGLLVVLDRKVLLLSLRSTMMTDAVCSPLESLYPDPLALRPDPESLSWISQISILATDVRMFRRVNE